MQTFFLNEGLNRKPEYLTESEIEREFLIFENKTLESELIYNQIIQEAILTEGAMLLEADGKKGRLAKAGETVIKFFKNIIEWFAARAKDIGNFISTVMDKVIKKVYDISLSIRKMSREDIANLRFTSTHKYIALLDKVNVAKLLNLINVNFDKAATKDDIKDEKKDNVAQIKEFLKGLSKKTGGSSRQFSVGEASDFIEITKKRLDQFKGMMKNSVSYCKDGIKTAQEGIKIASNLKYKDDNRINELKQVVINNKKRINSINAQYSLATSAFSSLANHLGTKVLVKKATGLKEKKKK